MVTEQQTYCDLCGEKVEKEGNESGYEFDKYWSLDLGRLSVESDYDIRKDLCENCTRMIYNRLQNKLHWEN